MPIVTNAGGWVGGQVAAGAGGGLGGAVGGQSRAPQVPMGGGFGAAVGQQASPSFGPPSMPPSSPLPSSPGPWRGGYVQQSGPPSMPSTAPSGPGPWRGDFISQNEWARAPYESQYRQGADFAKVMNAPDILRLYGEADNLDKRMKGVLGNNAAQQRYLRGDYGSDVAMNDIARRGLDADRSNLATNRERVGLDIAGRGPERAYIDQMQSIADRALANDLAGVDANLATDTRNINSEFTSRGAWFAPFRGLEVNDARGAADRSRTDLGLGREQSAAGAARDRANLDFADQRSQLDYKDLASAESRLDLEAQKLGVQRADLDRILQQGLDQLGYADSMTTLDLAAMMNSNNAQQRQLADQIVMDGWMYGGMIGQDPVAMRVLGDAMRGAQGY